MLSALFDSFEKKYKFFFFLIVLIAGFNLFFALGQQPVNDWDESRHGVTAYEMNRSHNYILTTYKFQPDYWNLKPPLGSWLIAMSFKIFGNTRFALRFPSAVMAFLTIILMMIIARKLFDKRVSIMAGFIIVTCFWFIFSHAGRTGDFDSHMALTVTLCIYLLICSETNPIWFSVTGLAAAAGFLLKSFASVQIIGIILCYLIFTKRFRKYQLRYYLLFGLFLIIPVGFWVILRYYQDGLKFFTVMVDADLLKRGFQSIENGHQHPLYFFYLLLWGPFPWSVFLMIWPFFIKKHHVAVTKNNLLWAWLLFPLFFFTVAQTKYYWYINPIYPAMAIFLALIVEAFLLSQYPKKKMIMVLFVAFFILAEARSIYTIFDLKKSYEKEIMTPIDTKTSKLSQSQQFRLEVLKEGIAANIPCHLKKK